MTCTPEAPPDWINPPPSEKKALALPPLASRFTTPSPSFSAYFVGNRFPQLALLSVHIFWACFPVGRSPLAPPGVLSTDSSLSSTYFPAALLQCATASQQTEAPGRTGAVHSELDGLSLSREEIETDHRVTALSISISLPSGELTKVSPFHRLLSAECGG